VPRSGTDCLEDQRYAGLGRAGGRANAASIRAAMSNSSVLDGAKLGSVTRIDTENDSRSYTEDRASATPMAGPWSLCRLIDVWDCSRKAKSEPLPNPASQIGISHLREFPPRRLLAHVLPRTLNSERSLILLPGGGRHIGSREKKRPGHF